MRLRSWFGSVLSVCFMLLIFPVLAFAAENNIPVPSVGTAVDKATDFVITKFNDLLSATQAALPKATEYVLLTIKITKINDLVYSGVSVLGALILFPLAVFLFLTSSKEIAKEYRDRNEVKVEGCLIIGVIATFVGIVSLIGGIGGLINVWTWVGVFHPDLYLVHEAVQKVLR